MSQGTYTLSHTFKSRAPSSAAAPAVNAAAAVLRQKRPTYDQQISKETYIPSGSAALAVCAVAAVF